MEAEIFVRAQQLQETHAQLFAANQRLDRLDQLRTQVFANISHELRTPLTLIIGLAGKRLGAPGRGAEEVRDLQNVARDGRTLLMHVNELLDSSKLAAGEMQAEYAAIDLAALVRSLADEFDVIARERAIAYSHRLPLDVMAEVDAHKIQRVLMNLLSNAFKFTACRASEGRRSGLSCSSARLREKRGHPVRRVVTDARQPPRPGACAAPPGL
jgi:signal transduction histidine kinase